MTSDRTRSRMSRVKTAALPMVAVVMAAAATSAGAPAPALAAVSHGPATKIRIKNFTVGTFDNSYPVKNGGSYTETCEMDDPVFGLTVSIKGLHTHKHASYSFKATYNGMAVAAYDEHWKKNGTETTTYVVDNDIPDYGLDKSGTLTVTFYIDRHKVASGHITLNVPSSCS